MKIEKNKFMQKNKRKKFVTDFFLIDEGDVVKKSGHWIVFDYTKKEKVSIRFAKDFKKAVDLGGKLKNPAYYQLAPAGGKVLIPITLHYKGKSITMLAVPDSGSSTCVFSSVVADYLGINLKKAKKIKAYGGTNYWGFQAYEAPVELEVAGRGNLVKTNVHFLRQKNCPTLAGYAGFFSHYEVIFNPRTVISYRFYGKINL